MNNSLKEVYDIFKNNISILGPVPTTIDQYNPHLGFSNKSLGSSFEDDFLPLLAANNISAVKSMIAKELINIHKLPISCKSYKTYCSKFLNFLDIVISNNKYSSILKNIQAAYHIDGIETLIESLGGEKTFIKKAIEHSYFFNPELVTKRFNDILNLYNSSQPIPARWQTIRKCGIRPQCGYNFCDIDANGNAKVCAEINKASALTISSGKSSKFQNFKISHIWGQAQNPRYFTNFWNIVFVPAWANDLLDKSSAISGSIASKMINTYMAICIQYYNMNAFSWSSLSMSMPTVINSKDIIHGNYNFFVINPSTSGYPVPFGKVSITI